MIARSPCRLRLLGAPTPVHPAPALGDALGVADLWIKRDDLTAVPYGGNKPRKLEHLLAHARARGCRRVVTFGGLGTNHGLATAVHAAGLGIGTTLVLVPQPVTPRVVHALRMDAAFGAELVLAAGPTAAVRRAAAVLLRSWRAGEKAMPIPPGGSSPLGTVGFVAAALELAEQVRAGALPAPGAVYVAVGSGGTAAGLALGLALAGLPTRVVGVLVTDVLAPSPGRLRRLAHAAGRRFGGDAAAVRLPDDAIALVRDCVGRGYGHPTPEARAAVELAERLEGLALETTYTGKCLAGLARREREAGGTGPVLFWNTASSIEPLPPAGVLPPLDVLPAPVRRALGDVSALRAC